jgi:hypothetical protein
MLEVVAVCLIEAMGPADCMSSAVCFFCFVGRFGFHVCGVQFVFSVL